MNFAPSILSRNANRNLPLAAGARRQQSLLLVWAAFSISVLSFCLAGLLGEKLGFATLLLRVVGSSTCGLAWLLTRSLFRSSAKTETWPLVVVGLLFLGGAVVILSEAVWLGVTDVNVALRVTDSALSLIDRGTHGAAGCASGGWL